MSSKPKGESSKALAMFDLYRDMGNNRSTAKLQQELGRPKSYKRQLDEWSRLHNWVARAKAHDQAISDAAAEADKQARIEDAERRRLNRLRVSDGERGKAAQALALIKPEDLAKRPYAIVQMFDHADKTERLDTNQPTSRTVNELTGKDGGPIEGRMKHEGDFDDIIFLELYRAARAARRGDGAAEDSADGGS